MKKTSAQGFTLLEMAVVVTIIALIVGGILYGTSLIATSRLQTVITDYNSYATAIGNFKQQYQSLPGDIATATSIWGTDSSGCPSGGGATGTCNGNADGEIGTVSGQEYESFRFWQHLYYAGMFPKLLSGVMGSTGNVSDANIGANVPAGSMEGSGFTVAWWGTKSSGDTSYFPGFYGNVFIFGAANRPATLNRPIITPVQAVGIDGKIDDGIPSSGIVRSVIPSPASPWTSNCTTGSGPYTYNISSTGILCDLIFLTGY